MKTIYKQAVRHASVRSFALKMMPVDAVLLVAFVATAGVSAFVLGDAATMVRRGVLAILASAAAYAFCVIVRVLAPFVLCLSFADMMRLRLPFYLWMASAVAVAGICGGPRLFATPNAASVQLTLILLSAALTIRFFRNGALPYLVLAFCCAGGAFGISSLGILAPVVMFVLMRVISRRMLVVSNLAYWRDPIHPGVVEYFVNPTVRARMKWLFAAGFLACAALAGRFALRGAGDPFGMARTWFGCLGADSLLFLLVTAVLPLLIALVKAARSSDVAARPGFGGLFVYAFLVPSSALCLLRPLLLPSLLGLHLRVEPLALTLASVVYAYDMLLAGIIVLIDIRCRDFRDEEDAQTRSLRTVMRVTYAFVAVVPLALVAYVLSPFFR